MNRNPLWMACIIVALAFGGLGFSCDPDIDACPEGEYDCHGECIPEGEECPAEECPEETPVRCPDGTCVADESECGVSGGCRDEGTCDPNYYADHDGGDYPTSGYTPRMLRRSSGAVEGDYRNGDFFAINAYAENSQVYYWLLTEVEYRNNNWHPANVFQDGVITVNRIFEFIRPDGSYILDQNPIIEATPDMPNYSPLVQVWYVHVPDNYDANTIKSLDTIDAAAQDEELTGIWLEPTPWVILLEVTDPSVGLHRVGDIQPDWQPQPLTVWNDGQAADSWIGFVTSADDRESVYVQEPPGGDWSIMPEPWPNMLFQPVGCLGQNVYEERNEQGKDLYSPVVNRMFVDPLTGGCDGFPTNALDIFEGLSDGTLGSTTQPDAVLVTSQFPFDLLQ